MDLVDRKKINPEDIINPEALKITSKNLGVDISILLTWRKEYIMAKFLNNESSLINLARSLSVRFDNSDMDKRLDDLIKVKNKIKMIEDMLNPTYFGYIGERRYELMEELSDLMSDREIISSKIIADIDGIFNNKHILGKKEITFLQIANSKTVVGFANSYYDYEDDTKEDADLEDEG